MIEIWKNLNLIQKFKMLKQNDLKAEWEWEQSLCPLKNLQVTFLFCGLNSNLSLKGIWLCIISCFKCDIKLNYNIVQGFSMRRSIPLSYRAVIMKLWPTAN